MDAIASLYFCFFSAALDNLRFGDSVLIEVFTMSANDFVILVPEKEAHDLYLELTELNERLVEEGDILPEKVLWLLTKLEQHFDPAE